MLDKTEKTITKLLVVLLVLGIFLLTEVAVGLGWSLVKLLTAGG